MALLEIDDLVAGYGSSAVVHGISLTVDHAQVVALIGPNGAGKSTLIKAIFGLCTVHSGNVVFEGKRLSGLRPSQIVSRGLAYLPQVENVFPSLTVRENLEMGAFLQPKGAAKRIDELVEMIPDLRPTLKRPAGELSGGQRTMLGLARALMTRPTMLLLDEPTAGLSPVAADRVWNLIAEIVSSGAALVIVEQNARRALEAADRGFVLTSGRIARAGGAQELLDSDDIVELFLGTMPAV
ncbi:MAG: ABC transporter ATP-binding protein [Chloroflexi bacterium]|nr:ABC transporter ATP-binding protein [Chloroflexota bacterium]